MNRLNNAISSATDGFRSQIQAMLTPPTPKPTPWMDAAAQATATPVTPNQTGTVEDLTPVVYEKMTKPQLIEIAGKRGIKVAKSWTKDRIIAALSLAVAA
jgi:hypothetical protein